MPTFVMIAVGAIWCAISSFALLCVIAGLRALHHGAAKVAAESRHVSQHLDG